ncbi:MAG TPA: DUF3536 domain-containing protein, partial [Longimicrobiales bacterium]|nr:DUF3536 domain-containing protein [Longimicrobiales bacterium]
HRFGRRPEGMWLPETAVDLESLDLMAEAGIRFTVLAPHQAEAVRPSGEEAWRPVEGEHAHTGRAYRVELPSGREMAVFFYDAALARGVAFEGLLSDGETFSRRLEDAFEGLGSEAPLVHLATDGETYGHHHRHGEMALSFALRSLVRRDDIELTNYGEYLELHPPSWEARVREDTSWSCTHGVERWRSDCGCRVGGPPGWSQAWRGPLRSALDFLRDRLEPHWIAAASERFHDPWEARDHYIDVVLDRSDSAVARFLDAKARGGAAAEWTPALRLMELQRHLMLMYTSCGWFFDDVSGLEAVQVLRYAGRVLHLAEELFPELELEGDLLDRLAEAPSNVPEEGDGRRVFVRSVRPSRIDLPKAAAHYAVSSAFEEYEPVDTTYCYRFERIDERRLEAGRATLLLGRVEVTSLVTRNSQQLSYAVLHLGNHNVTGGVRPYRDEGTYEALVDEVGVPFGRTDFTTVIRVLDQEFAASTYSLRSLFRDARLRIVDTILETSVEEAESAFGRIYEDHAPLLRFLVDLGIPAPRPFQVAAEYVVNARLKRIFGQPSPHLPAIRAALDEAEAGGLALDRTEVGYQAQLALEREMDLLQSRPFDLDAVVRIERFVELLKTSALPVDLWRVQNGYWRMVQAHGLAAEADMARADDPALGPEPVRESPPEGTLEREGWAREMRSLGVTLEMEGTLA